MDILFGKASLNDVFRGTHQRILKEIGEFQTEYILNVSTEDLVEHLVDKYKGNPPILHEDRIEICDQGELKGKNYDNVPKRIGVYFVFAVPFSGESEFFFYMPSSFTSSLPRGFIVGNELRLRYERGDHNPEVIKKSLNEEIRHINEYLDSVRKDVEKWNCDLEPFIRKQLQSRKDLLLKDKGLVASLGIPIRQRSNAPLTYTAPVSRKKISIKKPAAIKSPYKPEPELQAKTYEEILSTLRNMVLVMERSPQAFQKMGEEDLRTHFLVQLNGQYEGQATGETFNFNGKTDILIRINGKNIFIAECKIWHGQKALKSTIDQLLDYLSWRDTKVAILVFNRNKELTSVLNSIPEVIEVHQNFKRMIDHNVETEFKFILHSNVDKNRELIVTLLVFDLPK
jgi:hypothetical protein